MSSIQPSQLIIERETPHDIDSIYQVNLAAFGRADEAKVVNELRKNCEVFLSFVAKIGSNVIGHILFTPALIKKQEEGSTAGLGLAPLAVTPAYQGQGVGSALCEAGLKYIENFGYPYVVVLGSPRYYPRFGFRPAGDFGIRCAYENIPPEDFMIIIFDKEKMMGVSGIAYYRSEFDRVS